MTAGPGIVNDGTERATVAPAEDDERVLNELRRCMELLEPPVTVWIAPSEVIATVLRAELAVRGVPARVFVAPPGVVAPESVIRVRTGLLLFGGPLPTAPRRDGTSSSCAPPAR